MSMTDREIVERLRNGEERKYDCGVFIYTDLAAADAIERLTKERDEAIEALRDAVYSADEIEAAWSGIPTRNLDERFASIERARSILSKHEVKP